MQQRDNLGHLILASIAGLVLTSLMAVVDAQAQIASCLIGMGILKSM